MSLETLTNVHNNVYIALKSRMTVTNYRLVLDRLRRHIAAIYHLSGTSNNQLSKPPTRRHGWYYNHHLLDGIAATAYLQPKTPWTDIIMTTVVFD